MFQSFPHISTVLLTSAILLVAAPTTGRAHLSQEPATTPATPAPPPPPAVNNPVKATPGVPVQSQENLWGYDCAMCHGANGQWQNRLWPRDMQLTLNDWTDPKALDGKSDGDLFQVIRSGKGKMPPEDASRAKDDDVWNLVAYVRSVARKGAAASNPAQ